MQLKNIKKLKTRFLKLTSEIVKIPADANSVADVRAAAKSAETATPSARTSADVHPFADPRPRSVHYVRGVCGPAFAAFAARTVRCERVDARGVRDVRCERPRERRADGVRRVRIRLV